MSTLHQLVTRNKRIEKKRKCHVPRLDKCPFKKGTITKIFIQTPKKPNSAKRKVARVSLSNRKFITCHIPGIGHSLQAHSIVLIRGGRCQDLIGVRYKPIRGIFDLTAPKGRVTRRSKYGVRTK